MSAALQFLIDSVISLYVAVIMFRVLLHASNANFYNPVTQFVMRLTNPPLKPISTIFPVIKRIDTAAIVLMLGLLYLQIWLRVTVSPAELGAEKILAHAGLKLIQLALQFYVVLIVARVLLSWLGPTARHPIIPLIVQITQPVLQPVQRWIQPVAGIDISPMIVILLLQALSVWVTSIRI